MLKLYDMLRAARTGIFPNMWNSLAAETLLGADFERIKESDCIYSGGTLLYYIGKSRRPEVPSVLGGVPVRVIERTAFADNTDIKAVKIPEGTEVIE